MGNVKNDMSNEQYISVSHNMVKDNRLSPRAKEVYMYLGACAYEGLVVKQTDIANTLGVSRHTVVSAIGELKSNGYIDLKVQHHNNGISGKLVTDTVYTLKPVDTALSNKQDFSSLGWMMAFASLNRV